jgi:hypothetical protein
MFLAEDVYFCFIDVFDRLERVDYECAVGYGIIMNIW